MEADISSRNAFVRRSCSRSMRGRWKRGPAGRQPFPENIFGRSTFEINIIKDLANFNGFPGERIVSSTRGSPGSAGFELKSKEKNRVLAGKKRGFPGLLIGSRVFAGALSSGRVYSPRSKAEAGGLSFHQDEGRISSGIRVLRALFRSRRSIWHEICFIDSDERRTGDENGPPFLLS